jgi:ABC-type lipoprotein release transport system permease subunit
MLSSIILIIIGSILGIGLGWLLVILTDWIERVIPTWILVTIGWLIAGWLVCTKYFHFWPWSMLPQ